MKDLSVFMTLPHSKRSQIVHNTHPLLCILTLKFNAEHVCFLHDDVWSFKHHCNTHIPCLYSHSDTFHLLHAL